MTRSAFDIVGIIGIVVSVGLAFVGWTRDAQLDPVQQKQLAELVATSQTQQELLTAQRASLDSLSTQIGVLKAQLDVSERHLKLAEASEYYRFEVEFRGILRAENTIEAKLQDLMGFANRTRPARDTQNDALLGLFSELDQSITARQADLAKQEAAVKAAEAEAQAAQQEQARQEAEARAAQARRDEDARLAEAEAARRAAEERANTQRQQEFMRALMSERICFDQACTNWILP